MLAIASLTTLAALATSAFALVNPHHDQPRHHVPKSVEVRASNFTKRSYSGQATFYEAGLGACGTVNSDSDMIVALNIEQWDGGSHCYAMISITSDKGITQTAQITDQCPGCATGCLDMTPTLFMSLGHTEDDGVFQMTWDYIGAGAPAQPATSSTPAWTPPPSSTWQPPPTTSSPPPPPPTTSSAAPTTTTPASSSSSAASSSSASSGTDSSASASGSSTGSAPASSASAGTGDVSSQTGGNLNAQSKLLVQMANIIAAGGSS